MGYDEIKAKVDDLARRYSSAQTKKAQYEGQLSAKRQALLELKKEIEDAGFSPKNLKTAKEQLMAELETMIKDYDVELSNVEKVLDDLDKEAKDETKDDSTPGDRKEKKR